jgi:SAM-dependent methyltransferase
MRNATEVVRAEPVLHFGNWVQRKKLLGLGSCVLIAGLLLLAPLHDAIRIFLWLLFLGLSVCLFFPLYAYVMFSQVGGKWQAHLYALILDSLGDMGEGTVLDIGSGNGALAVLAAIRFPNAKVISVDRWGAEWEYSQGACWENARIGGVEKRIQFVEGDAAQLVFDSGLFDVVISNLTLHEVKSAPHARDALCEALRVVKPGGRFVFIDHFYEEKYFGKSETFNPFLSSLGLLRVECVPIKQLLPIPFLLMHPKIFGRVGIIRGVK